MAGVKISTIKANPSNPRLIKDDKFKKLCQSIKDLPKMMELRPIVVDENNIVQGGNMRLKALQELGYKEIPKEWVKQAKDFTPEELKEFIIKDNVGFGEWDWDILANEWAAEQLAEWGLDIPSFEIPKDEVSPYTSKIKTPVYSTKNEKPGIELLYNLEKYNSLISQIENSTIIDEHTKKFLKIAASRHILFNYSAIADFYAHSDKDIQELMESSGLVIIDFNKAIGNGFIKLSEEISKLYALEYDEE